MEYDAIVIGAGLTGLVATNEMARLGKKVLLLDQEPESSLGGQAWWSFGGLFFVDSPEQRRLRIKDSKELAWKDWLGLLPSIERMRIIGVKNGQKLILTLPMKKNGHG